MPSGVTAFANHLKHLTAQVDLHRTLHQAHGYPMAGCTTANPLHIEIAYDIVTSCTPRHQVRSTILLQDTASHLLEANPIGHAFGSSSIFHLPTFLIRLTHLRLSRLPEIRSQDPQDAQRLISSRSCFNHRLNQWLVECFQIMMDMVLWVPHSLP
jgi:hypothetical protein